MGVLTRRPSAAGLLLSGEHLDGEAGSVATLEDPRGDDPAPVSADRFDPAWSEMRAPYCELRAWWELLEVTRKE